MTPLYWHPATLMTAAVAWGLPVLAFAVLWFKSRRKQPNALPGGGQAFVVMPHCGGFGEREANGAAVDPLCGGLDRKLAFHGQATSLETSCENMGATSFDVRRDPGGAGPLETQADLYSAYAGRGGPEDAQEPTRSGRQRVIFAALFLFFIASYCNLLATNLLVFMTLRRHRHGEPDGHTQQEPLKDFLFETVPDGQCLQWTQSLFDASSATLPVVVAILITMGRARGIADLVVSTSVHFFLKQTTQSVTLLPAAIPNCWAEKTNNFSGSYSTMHKEWLWMFTSFDGFDEACSDMIYSGHVTTSLLGVLMIRREILTAGAARQIANVLLPALLLAQVYSIAACRAHYTVDIVLALCVSGVLHSHASLHARFWMMLNRAVGNPCAAAAPGWRQ